jgi:multidrug transporter EmrE-like cation transporter
MSLHICPTSQSQAPAQPRQMGRYAAPPCNDCATNPIVQLKNFVRRRICFCQGVVCLRLSFATFSIASSRHPFGGEYAIFVS